MKSSIKSKFDEKIFRSNYSQIKSGRANILISNEEYDDESYKISHEFVKDLFKVFVKLAIKFSNNQYNIIDKPYLYRERQLDSLIIPALSLICDGCVIGELPLIRSSKFEDDSSGRIDYWCIYKEYSFVIEVKHGYDNYKNDITRKRHIKNG